MIFEMGGQDLQGLGHRDLTSSIHSDSRYNASDTGSGRSKWLSGFSPCSSGHFLSSPCPSLALLRSHFQLMFVPVVASGGNYLGISSINRNPLGKGSVSFGDEVDPNDSRAAATKAPQQIHLKVYAPDVDR